MRLQGGKRTSPAADAEIRTNYNCNKCSFTLTLKHEIDSHIRNEHEQGQKCPFCQLGLNSLSTLKRHINTKHNEGRRYVENRPSDINQENVIPSNVNQKLCAFFQQPRGCKKGQNCDFSHNTNMQYNPVPKVCFNGVACTWRCKYVHPEDGKTFPTRPRPARGGVQGWQSNQDFVLPDVSQAPPGYTLTSMTDFQRIPSFSRKSD